MDLIELIRMVVRSEVNYLEEDTMRVEKKVNALAKALGKTVSREPQFEVKDVEAEKDE